MPAILALALSLAQETPSDPYNLPIGTPGTVHVQPGFTDSQTGRSVSPADIAKAARWTRFVLVGESHATPPHHQAQADIIRALAADGRYVVVGLEMLTKEKQSYLGLFSVGKVSVDAFPEYIDWKNQWGHDYNAYRPVFQAIHDLELPLYALNLPRDLVRRIGQEGPSAVKPEEKKWLPNLDLSNQNHRAVFTSLMGGHPLTGARGENIYAAQVSWDTGMAKSAIDAMEFRTSDKWVMVILAGIGHTMYEQGINYRIKQMTGEESLSIACLPADGPTDVSRGLSDYLFFPSK